MRGSARKWDSAGAHCNDDDLCDPEGAAINRRARLYGNVGTAFGVVGVAAMISGAVLYLTAPSARPVLERTAVGTAGSSTVHVGFRGSF